MRSHGDASSIKEEVFDLYEQNVSSRVVTACPSVAPISVDTVASLQSDLAMQSEAMKLSLADLESLKKQLPLEERNIDASASSICSNLPDRLDCLKFGVAEMELAADKHKEEHDVLQARIFDVETQLSDFRTSGPEKIEALVLSQLKALIMPMMEAAFTPLVTSLTSQMLQLEQKVCGAEACVAKPHGVT